MRRQALASQLLRSCVTVGLASAVALAGARAAPAAERTMTAASLLRSLRQGQAARADGVMIRGDLTFSDDVRLPVVLRDCTFLGNVSGVSSSFGGLIDLSRSTFRKGVDFREASFARPLLMSGIKSPRGGRLRFDYADFGGAVVLSGAEIHGRTSFSGAQFHSAARFRGAMIHGDTSFGNASFDDGGDFVGTMFFGAASFGSSEFRGTADFTTAEFNGSAAFNTARFLAPADFIGASFSGTARNTSFFGTRFDAGARFAGGEFEHGATFDLAEAPAEMDYEGRVFGGPASFSTVRFLGGVDMTHTDLEGLVNFDQAVVTRLDLDGAALNDSTIVLPAKLQSGQFGHIDELRLDPNDVGHLRAGNTSDNRGAREHALKLVEKTARAGGDDNAAREAEVRRKTLERHDKSAFGRAFDWSVLWGIGGYLVRPLHPFLALIALVFIVPLGRAGRRAWTSWRTTLTGFPGDLWKSFLGIWKFKIGEGSSFETVEAFFYKGMLAVLVLSIGNVYPTLHNLVGGVLP
jgi:uncharacterized protein YjbI with pentapeptide repeats